MRVSSLAERREKAREKLRAYRSNPLGFYRDILGFNPHVGQEKWLLGADQQENILVTGNRWGKSTSAAARRIRKCAILAGWSGERCAIMRRQHEPYRSINIAPTADQAKIVWMKAHAMLQDSRAAWLVEDVKMTPFPRMTFITGAVFEARSTAGHFLAGIEGKRKNTYCQTGSSYDNHHIDQGMLVDIIARMSDRMRAQNVDGAIIDGGGAFFAIEDISACEDTSLNEHAIVERDPEDDTQVGSRRSTRRSIAWPRRAGSPQTSSLPSPNMRKAKKAPEATEAVDATQASIAIASPVLGVMGSVASAAEQLGLAMQRSGAHVGLAMESVRQVFTGGFESSEDLPHPSAMLSFCEPNSRVAPWRRSRGGFYGVITASYAEMPAAWETGLSQAESIFAPSEWMAEVVQDATERPVEIARFGIDAATYSYTERKRGEKLCVLFFARNIVDTRKGVDTAIDAFVTAFEGRDDVELTIRSTEQHRLENPDPRIKFTFGPLAPAALADMYRSFDARFPSDTPIDVTMAYGYGYGSGIVTSPTWTSADNPGSGLTPGAYDIAITTKTMWGETVATPRAVTTATGSILITVNPVLGAYAYRAYIAPHGTTPLKLANESPLTQYGLVAMQILLNSLLPQNGLWPDVLPTTDNSAPELPNAIIEATRLLALGILYEQNNLANRGLAKT